MNALAGFLNSPLSETLGWTLIHSLWQGLVIVGILKVALRVIPTERSNTRFLASAGALVLTLLCSVSTFITLLPQQAQQAYGQQSLLYAPSSQDTPLTDASQAPLVFIQLFIHQHIGVITLMWLVGSIIFSLRTAGGFWYISTLRRSAGPVDDEWNEMLKDLARQMNIQRVIALAESAAVQAPFVIGHIRPLILMPAGMIAGLTTAQLESILIHELTHIRRNDYLLNIIQLFIEAAFFFNPFVWIISANIRREREHCCDDEAVKRGNPLAYACALAQLETLRLSSPSLAMPLAENNNQLLHRIKRIMERSVHHYSLRERIVPLALVVIGLMCASWITLKSSASEPRSADDLSLIVADTVKPGKKGKRSATDQKPAEVQGQYEYRYEFDTDTVFEFEPLEPVPPVADLHFDPIEPVPPLADIHFEPLEPMEPIAEIPQLDFHAFSYSFDNTFDNTFNIAGLPGTHFSITTGNGDWEAFSEELTEKFKVQFGDFYAQHGKEFEAMMENLRDSMSIDTRRFAAEQQQMQEEIGRSQVEVGRAMAEAQRDMSRQMAEVQRESAREMQRQQEEHRKNMDAHFKVINKNTREFERVMQEELVRDGYLKKGEKLKQSIWKDDGEILVNDKKIKKADKEKYRAIHKKYMEHID